MTRLIDHQKQSDDGALHDAGDAHRVGVAWPRKPAIAPRLPLAFNIRIVVFICVI